MENFAFDDDDVIEALIQSAAGRSVTQQLGGSTHLAVAALAEEETAKRAIIRMARDIINVVHDTIEDILLDEDEGSAAAAAVSEADEALKEAASALTSLAIYY